MPSRSTTNRIFSRPNLPLRVWDNLLRDLSCMSRGTCMRRITLHILWEALPWDSLLLGYHTFLVLVTVMLLSPENHQKIFANCVWTKCKPECCIHEHTLHKISNGKIEWDRNSTMTQTNQLPVIPDRESNYISTLFTIELEYIKKMDIRTCKTDGTPVHSLRTIRLPTHTYHLSIPNLYTYICILGLGVLD